MGTFKSVEDYIDELPVERKEVINKLRNTINKYLPEGFAETMSYDMISYVVPLSLYPNGYHAKKGEPLPFIQLASRKNFIAIYHMGLYTDHETKRWFVKEYQHKVPTKLDMGKSCIRLKSMKHIPYDLIGELCEKMTVNEWIKTYEQDIK